MKSFIRNYVKAIKESNAAIFAGAGLSQPAGFVNWKELMKEFAEDLSLDIDKETDLIALAQYHVNENNSRAEINQKLVQEFVKDAEITENHKILARLPVDTFWTTNYDKLIEDSLKKNAKVVDVKINTESLSTTTQNRDVIVYKMHGDISLPQDAVLTKDDYESYNTKRQLFTSKLQGDLVSKTFLFIGFSFDDPNVEYILSRIRILLGQNSRTHYCFMKKVDRKIFKNTDEYVYADIKQKLKINDLKRYNIKVILVNEYIEITKYLQTIESMVRRKNIFVSGSAAVYGDYDEKRAFEFSSTLSKKLIKNNNTITSGFGLGIGSCVISGALEELFSNKVSKIDDRLKLRPFPQTSTGEITLPVLWKKYREDMLYAVGIAIFIFGNKIDKNTGVIVDANGMEEEFNIAINNGVIPIPIGITGFTSKKIWEKVINDFDKYVPIESLKPKYIELADNSKSDSEIINIVIDIINALSNQKKD